MEATILNDRTLKEAAGLAAKGWKLVRLFGVTADGRCTCGKPGCATPGKHPEGGPEWQHRATDDEQTIASWFDSEEPVNIGVRLGAASGVVDVEFDSPEAEEVLKRFGLDRIDTPAYSSGRGVHRLFRFESWLPATSVDVDVSLHRGGVSYHLVKALSVPADSAVVVVGKENPFYLMEGDSVRIAAGSSGSVHAICSYGEIA